MIDSFDEYFSRNPFIKWFGKKEGYRIEGFLNGINASFYGIKPHDAVLIDLVPFVTINNFSNLKPDQLVEDLFITGWVQTHIDRLISYLNPMALIVFGRTTVEYFNEYVKKSINLNKEYIPRGKKSKVRNINL